MGGGVEVSNTLQGEVAPRGPVPGRLEGRGESGTGQEEAPVEVRVMPLSMPVVPPQ